MRTAAMRSVAALLLCAVLAACAGRPSMALSPAEPVGPHAVWRGSMRTLRAAVLEQCGEPGRAGLEPCFSEVMERLGSSPAAVRFSRSLDTPGCLVRFQETGPVDVGWVLYPFRANELQGCILVNGTPARLGVDDPSFWPLESLEQDALYRSLREAFPDLSIRPGDRAGPGRLALKALPENGRGFVAGYELRNGCRACEIVGSVDFAFDFDGDGNFLGSRVASMGSRLHVRTGETVTLTMRVPPGTKAAWQAVRLPPAGALRLLGKVRRTAPEEGGGEIESWAFMAPRPGRFLLEFRRVPAGTGHPLPEARTSFLVVVQEERGDAQASALAGVFASIIDQRLQEMGSPRAGKVVPRVKGVHEDMARVDIHPRNPDSEAWAMVYLERSGDRWEVVAMGQSFSEAFYREHGIAHDLRGPVDPQPPLVPFSPDRCEELLDALSEALGLEGVLEESVLFLEPAGTSRGEACRITLTGTGEQLPGLAETAGAVRSLLEKRGWTEDPAWAADGPLGTAGGFRKEGSLVLYRVVVEPAPEAGLLSNRPVSMAELLPEERLYSIVVEGAQRRGK